MPEPNCAIRYTLVVKKHEETVMLTEPDISSKPRCGSVFFWCHYRRDLGSVLTFVVPFH